MRREGRVERMTEIGRIAAVCAILGAAQAAAGAALAAPTEVAKLQLPGAPFDGIAVTPDGKKVYVSLVQSQMPGKNAIAVVDTATATVAEVIDLGDQGAANSSARQLYMAPDGGLLIHATYANNLIVVDTATDTVVDTLPLVGRASAVFTPDSAQLWSRDSNTKTLRVFDTATMDELASFPLLSPGSSDFPLVITPAGDKVYGVTANDGGNGFGEPQAVTAFDVAGLKQLKNYGVGAGFMANAGTDARISPDGKFLYTSGSNMTQIVKIDVASDTVVQTAAVPQFGEGLDLSPDGATLYAFENAYQSGKLRVYAADTLTLQQTLDMTGHVARFLATSRRSVFAPSGCAVIVPAGLKNAIFALDPQTHAKIATFDAPQGTPYTVAFAPNSTRAYVPWRNSAITGFLTILDLGESCALAPDGAACMADDACDSGACVDGVCCDSACGGGAPDDCQACSVAGGGAVDGVCGPIGAGATCRPAIDGTCDAAEQCDGVDLACPPDGAQADGEPCDGGTCQAGVCTPDPIDETTGDASSTGGAASTTGEPPATTGEPPATSTDTPGSASDSGSGSGEPGSTSQAPTTGPTNDTTTDATTAVDSAGGTGGEATVSDGCSCDQSRTDAGAAAWLVLLAGLAVRRRSPRAR